MSKTKWKNKIKKACIEAGTYKECFDAGIINQQAQIMEQLEKAALSISDAEPVIEQTNKSGFTNTVRNPAFTVWADLNRLALAGWKELGLTPSELRKINDELSEKTRERKQGNQLLELLKTKKKIDEGTENG